MKKKIGKSKTLFIEIFLFFISNLSNNNRTNTAIIIPGIVAYI